jgi:Bifunctional DNA primase/polymerase, N-terminal
MTTNPLLLARWFVARGFSVIPIPLPQPGISDGKTPVIPWQAYQSRRPSIHELETWFGSEPMNVAVVTGQVSHVVVVDADGDDGFAWCERLPYTPWQTKTAKGVHLYFRHPNVPVANRVRLRTNHGRLPVDVRGDGGFVIAPGSLHASGVRYLAIGNWTAPAARVPVFNPDWLPSSARDEVAKGNGDTASCPHSPQSPAFVRERARRYLAAIPPPIIGQGSDLATFQAASRLVRGFALDAAEAETLLWDWCGNRDGWSREWVARKVAHAERYAREPLKGLLS